MLNLTQVPKINQLFRLQFETAQDCFVLLYPEGMIKLNSSAGAIMVTIDGNKTIESIVGELEQSFPEAGSLTNDVSEFFITALDKKWVYYD
jgi:pyrroloquinoline quinone biosynthesis protein D